MGIKIAAALYIIVGLFSLAAGLVFVTSDSFVGYHSIAVGMEWEEVPEGFQALILALMRVAAGGWLALSVFIFTAVLLGGHPKFPALRWILPVAIVAFYAPTFYATWTVYTETGAPTPWLPSLVMIVLAPLAYGLDAWGRRA